MFVTERFYLSEEFKQRLREQPVKWGFGLLSVATYYRTYSRRKEDGSNEDWADTVIRCVEGVLSIRKDWYRTVGVKWDHRYWSRLGEEMAEAMFNFRFLPPGRSLWAMGTEYVYERGAMALQNCGAVQVELDAFGKPNLSVAASWAMDALMCGVGAGFGLPRFLHDLKNPNLLRLGLPSDTVTYTYQIPDTREGWAESVRMLIESYELSAQAGNHYPTKLIGPQATIDFDYSLIRQAGATISGFGGVASGPEPLIWLHKQLRSYLNRYVGGSVSQTRLVADIFNAIGACVVAGNVRRSAEIALGSVRDTEFLNLKNYRLYPERAEIGWLSNNSVILQDSSDFAALPNIAERIRDNGEPGVVNLINIQKYGRFKEKKPDRATLMNPCVRGSTRILTRRGYERIDALVDTPVEVWNGTRWSAVTPIVTGFDQPMLKINFSDGTSLVTTHYHKFHISESYQQTEPLVVAARDLSPGAKLWKYVMPIITPGHGVDPVTAYTQGVYAGDGHYDDARQLPSVWLYGEKQSFVDSLSLRRDPYYHAPSERTLAVLNVADISKAFVPFDWDARGRVAWLAGLLDTDGTLLVDGSTQITSVNREFLLETRLMLTTLGVQAKVVAGNKGGMKLLPDGHGGKQEYHCRDTYRLLINAADMEHLVTLGLATYVNRIVDVADIHPQRDARRFVTVVSVEDAGVDDLVYCFEEPLNHTGTFEGIVTGQCAEQPLESFEVCCLVEVFPTRCADYDELYEAMELATIYASSVSLLRTHSEETNAVVMRNHRIGVSLSGIADWLDTTSASGVTMVLRHGYEDVVVPTNKCLAEEAGVPVSVRVTTVKPSGTISLLAGVSPGMHHPVFRYGVRRMRVSKSSPLGPMLAEAGIPFEEDSYDPLHGTWVFEFPQESGGGKVRSVSEVSLWEQASIVAWLQREWSDNAVSNTLTFSPSREGNQIERVLSTFAPLVKSISMLPDQSEQQSYAQPPYEKISREEYRERMKQLKEIDWAEFSGGDGQDTKFCDGDVCELPEVSGGSLSVRVQS